MVDMAAELAMSADKGERGKREEAAAVMQAAETPGPHRCTAVLGAELLARAIARIDARKTTVVVPAEVVAGEAPSTGPAPPSPTCAHPSDVACPACAPGFLERRNAEKRAARAQAGKR
jgi:hypothetical protein